MQFYEKAGKHKNNRKTTKMPLIYIIFTAFVASYVWFYTCHMWVWVQQCRDTKKICSVDSNFSLWTANQNIEIMLTVYVLATGAVGEIRKYTFSQHRPVWITISKGKSAFQKILCWWWSHSTCNWALLQGHSPL